MYFQKLNINFTLSIVDANNLPVEVDEKSLCFNPQDAAMFQHNNDKYLVGIYDNVEKCVHWYDYTTSHIIAPGKVYVPFDVRVIHQIRGQFAIYV